jgi:hypothetical protein
MTLYRDVIRIVSLRDVQLRVTHDSYDPNVMFYHFTPYNKTFPKFQIGPLKNFGTKVVSLFILLCHNYTFH